jgi:PAS domain S-box-containing protein
MSQVSSSNSPNSDENLEFNVDRTGMDSEEQKAALQEREQFLASIYEGAAEAIFIVDVLPDGDFRYLHFNPAAERLTGLSFENVKGKTPEDIVPPEAAAKIRQRYSQCVESGEKVTYEECLPFKGEETWWLTTLQPLRDSNLHIYRLVGTSLNITDRKQTEKALEESERRFRAIFNQTFQFIGLMQPDGILIEANQTALDFGGLTTTDVINRPFWEGFWWTRSPETQAQLRSAIQAAAAGQFIRYEVEVLGAGDRVVMIDFSIKPVKDETGRVVLLIPEGRDITERKQAEAEIIRLNHELEQKVAQRTSQLENALLKIQESADRLSLALDASKMGLWDWALASDRVFWTPYHEQIFGYETGTPERTYTEWESRVHPEDLSRVKTAIEKALSDRGEYACQYRIVLPNGTVGWIDALGRCYCDAANRPVRMLGMVKDITDRKRAEEALRQSEERFRATFEQAAVGVAHVGINGQWLRVNQKLCDIVGYSREELLERTFQEITYADDLKTDLNYVRQLLAGEIDTYSLEKRYICKDGSLVWVELTVSLVRESNSGLGEPKYFISVVEEISDRKHAEIALQERAAELEWLTKALTDTTSLLKKRNQELDQFAYVASHDLKAPLRAIANLSEWIEEDLEGKLPAENQRQIQILRGRVHRLEALINGLLEYSRVGRTEIAPETVDVAKLLANIIDSLDPPPTFTIEIEAGMPTLTAKKIPLFQVFSNLIGNAIKHHHRDNGHIKISVRDRGKFYEFAVTDDGPGIDPKHHERVFDIFQTLQSRDQIESTGIGLAIVKKIIEAEGGTIHLESKLGDGSTFRFTWVKS